MSKWRSKFLRRGLFSEVATPRFDKRADVSKKNAT